jgi:hypothetical protein
MPEGSTVSIWNASSQPQSSGITDAPDVVEAHRFLDLIAPDEDVTFHTFPDPEILKSKRSLNRVLHGRLHDHQEELARLNDDGAGIFFMVNAGDGTVHEGEKTFRTSKNVVRVRANFIDLDGSPLDPVLACPVPPSIVVCSSPGRWHAYWLINGEELDQFRPIQEQLITRFKADPSVKDLPRVMRLPGYLHRKHEPFRVHIVHPLKKEVKK